jgi:mRNA interferase MazF
MMYGEIWWADMAEPIGSEAGYKRPVVIVQTNSLNVAQIRTVVVVPFTTNLEWANKFGNVFVPRSKNGPTEDSVAMTIQVSSVDKSVLTEKIGKLSAGIMREIRDGLAFVFEIDE